MEQIPSKPVLYLRATLFWIGMTLSTLVIAPLSLLTFPFNVLTRYRFIANWARFNIWWLQKTCKLNYKVIGAENIPEGGAIALVKHQSTWETYAFQQILPPFLKKVFPSRKA